MNHTKESEHEERTSVLPPTPLNAHDQASPSPIMTARVQPTDKDAFEDKKDEGNVKIFLILLPFPVKMNVYSFKSINVPLGWVSCLGCMLPFYSYHFSIT